MNIIKTQDYQDMSRTAAEIIAKQIDYKKNSVLGLATGSTVLQIYAILAKSGLDFFEITTFNLDEYVGIAQSNKNSYWHFMKENLFEHINIKQKSINFPQENIQKDYRYYDQDIENKGGIDLQLLGLGHNGHIGFNEPSEDFIKYTHCTNLCQSTIDANSRFFDSKDSVPQKAITMGIKTIMNAKKIMLCVSGKEKSAILKKALCDEITPRVPASVLQLHPNLTVVADKDALNQI